MATFDVPQEDIRYHFYDFINCIAVRLDVKAFAKFLQEYMNDYDLRFQPRMTSVGYYQHLYKHQLINPRNLDCIFDYAIHTRDDELQQRISGYYSKVGGRVELLIPVQFNPPLRDTR